MKTKNEDNTPEDEGSKPPKKRRGAPPPTGMANRKHSGTVCTATRRDGSQCTNFAIKGATVCRMHGGSAPQVRRAAQVRLLMQADNLMGALLKIALNEKLPVQHRLVAIRDGLDRANLAGTQNIEVTVEKGKTFEDFVGDAIIDVAEDDDDNPNVWDADVIADDDEPLVPRDPEVQNRYDRAVFAEVERGQPLPTPKRALSQVERSRMEAEERAMLGGVAPTDDDPDDRPARRMSREELLLAKDAGYNFSSRGEARRAAVTDDEHSGRRHTRIRNGGMGGR